MTEDTVRFHCPKPHRENNLCLKFVSCQECWHTYLNNGGEEYDENRQHIEEGATL